MLKRLAGAALCALMTDAAFAQAPPVSKEIVVTREVLTSYVGAYEMAPGEIVKILLRADRFIGIDPMGTPADLVAESESTFVTLGDGVQLQFFKDGTGSVTHLVVLAPLSSAKAERIRVPSETLSRFVGVYPLSFGGDMTITLERDRLMAQVTGQEKYQLFPESQTRFFVQDDTTEVEFGMTPAPFVVVRQNGDEQKAMRK
jgi:hypothetical protein